MSLLEQQLKELQTKKEKIGYLKEAISALEMLKIPKEGDEPAIEGRRQAVESITEFINNQITALEEGREAKSQNTQISVEAQFTPNEVEVLKTFVARAQNRPVENQAPQQRPRPSGNNGAFQDDDEAAASVDITRNKPQPPAKKGQDILQFAMAHRHLDGKRVIVSTKNGNVGGVVRGMMMPNIVVITDTGHEAHVPPEQLTVE